MYSESLDLSDGAVTIIGSTLSQPMSFFSSFNEDAPDCVAVDVAADVAADDAVAEARGLDEGSLESLDATEIADADLDVGVADFRFVDVIDVADLCRLISFSTALR